MTQTEREFQNAVTDYATLRGYLVYHTYRSTRSIPGYPDLTIVGNGKVLFAELKREGGKATEAQTVWLDAINDNGGQAYLWMPSMWDEIEQILK